MEIPEMDLPKPQSNDLKELIEYQNIYQFYIKKITTSKYQQSYDESKNLTNIILHDNYTDKKDISIKAEYLNRINTIRGNIINGNKNLLIQWEEILEFTNSKFTESNYQQEMKRKPGKTKNQ